jgi:polysaccharide export outer membrane protein
VAYLVDVPLNQPREFVEEYDLHIKKNDVLSIFVFSKEPSLAAPFNMELTQDQLFGNNTTNNNQSRTYEESRQGFIVDSDGYIDYPVFGKLKVEGLTREQISDMSCSLPTAISTTRSS